MGFITRHRIGGIHKEVKAQTEIMRAAALADLERNSETPETVDRICTTCGKRVVFRGDHEPGANAKHPKGLPDSPTVHTGYGFND